MATPVFCCGFECGQFGLTALHWAVGGSAAFDTGVVRNGARSMRMNPSASGSQITSAPSFSTNFLVARFYIRFASFPTSNAMLFSAGAGNSGVAFNNSDSSIYAGNNETTPVFGASGVSVVTGVWYRVDVKIDTNADPTLIDVQVDGLACGQHSFATASAPITVFRLGSSVAETYDAYYDDFILSGTSVDYPIGAGFVNHFVPTSDGTHNVAGTNDFERTLTGTDIDNTTTTAYQLVDDIPLESGDSVDWINLIAPPNATDYVEVVFGPAPGINTPTTKPRAVEFTVAFHALATQTNNLRVAYRDNNGATQDDVRSATVGSTTVLYARKQYAAIPGGGAWTVTAFNNSRARCYSSDPTPDPYVDGYMIEAEFETVSQPVIVMAPYLPPVSYGHG